jgi:hypothetical protein
VGVGVERSFTYSRTNFALSRMLLPFVLDPVLAPVSPAAAAAAAAAGSVTPVTPLGVKGGV